MSRARAACAVDRCPWPAVRRGRCLAHAEQPFAGQEAKRDARGVLRGRALQRERAKRIAAAGGRCERCGGPPPLELHHEAELWNYERTIVLCRPCHRGVKKEPRRRVGESTERPKTASVITGPTTRRGESSEGEGRAPLGPIDEPRRVLSLGETVESSLGAGSCREHGPGARESDSPGLRGRGR